MRIITVLWDEMPYSLVDADFKKNVGIYHIIRRHITEDIFKKCISFDSRTNTTMVSNYKKLPMLTHRKVSTIIFIGCSVSDPRI
jgi:hypothetical protein